MISRSVVPDAPRYRPAHLRRPSRTRRSAVAAAAVVGTACTGVFAWGVASAAFTAPTQVNGQSWQAGTVTIAENRAAAALFQAEQLQPGYELEQCIQVTYTGTLAADVAMYAQSRTGTGLYPYLDVVIDQGTGGDAQCAGFTPAQTLKSSTLATLVADNGDALAGLDKRTGVTSGSVRSYRVRMTLQDNPAAANQNAAIAFVWEARQN